MQNNTSKFLEQHPDFHPIIAMHLIGWEEEFGEDIYIDVAESHDDADARRGFYTSHGYKFMDENCFGEGFDLVGIIQCYLPEKQIPTNQPEEF